MRSGGRDGLAPSYLLDISPHNHARVRITCHPRPMDRPDISHIKLPVPRQHTMLDESDDSISHERRQPSNQAHKTIFRRPELAVARQRRQLSPRLHSPQLLQAYTSFLGYPSSPPMTPGMLVTMALHGVHRIAPAPAEIHPEVLLRQRAESPGAGRGEIASPRS